MNKIFFTFFVRILKSSNQAKMRIIYIHQYFKKITENGSHRSWYLANALSSAGFDVQIITAHNFPSKTEKINENFMVHYLNVPYDNGFSIFKRILAFLAFFWKSFFLARKLIKENQKNNKVEKNLIYATSTPLTVGITAFLLEKFYKIPYFFEVRDLWPSFPIKLKFSAEENHLSASIYLNSN